MKAEILDGPAIEDVAKRRGWIKPSHQSRRAARRPTPPASPAGACRYAISLEVTCLHASERDLLNTLLSILTDPKLDQHRTEMREGKLTLMIDGDEVTWIDPREGVLA